MMNPSLRPSIKRADGRERDPYLARLAPEDKAVCSGCHAIYHNKHWALDEKMAAALLKKGAVQVQCPACQKIHDHFPSGIITLRW